MKLNLHNIESNTDAELAAVVPYMERRLFNGANSQRTYDRWDCALSIVRREQRRRAKTNRGA